MHRLATLALPCSLLVSLAFACADAPGSDDPSSETGEGDGDSGDGESEGGSGEALRPNWHEDIAPLLYEHCVACHRDDGIAPFSLESYDSAAAWAVLLRDAVAEGSMPPWGALETDECQHDHQWANDLRLTSAQKQLLADWVEVGRPEGDPESAAELPSPPKLDLEAPTAIFQNPSPFVVTGSKDSFICYSIDPQLDTDVWITGVQMIPDNEQVVHHVLIYADPEANSAAVAGPDGSYPCFGVAGVDNAQLIGTWVPGAVPTEMPANVALPLPAGSRIILAYHYHPTGAGDEVDQSSVALRYSETPPLYRGSIDMIGNFPSAPGLLPGPNDLGGTPVFYIPANASGHTETMRVEIPAGVPPVDIFTLGTHMHYIGVDMRVWIERKGEQICMIQTPRWNFNWQRTYNIDASIGKFPKVQGGDVVMLECTYENTLANPFLAMALAQQGLSEPTNVVLGESSLDEMCLLLFGVAYPNLP